MTFVVVKTLNTFLVLYFVVFFSFFMSDKDKKAIQTGLHWPFKQQSWNDESSAIKHSSGQTSHPPFFPPHCSDLKVLCFCPSPVLCVAALLLHWIYILTVDLIQVSTSSVNLSVCVDAVSEACRGTQGARDSLWLFRPMKTQRSPPAALKAFWMLQWIFVKLTFALWSKLHKAVRVREGQSAEIWWFFPLQRSCVKAI